MGEVTIDQILAKIRKHLYLSKKTEYELMAEIRAHLEDAIAEAKTNGHDEQAALAKAAKEFGVDEVGDLDALTVYSYRGFGRIWQRDSARVWLNDGSAKFTAGQRLTFKPQHALALADLNGDGYVDVFAGSVNHGILVWFNDGAGKFTNQQ